MRGGGWGGWGRLADVRSPRSWAAALCSVALAGSACSAVTGADGDDDRPFAAVVVPSQTGDVVVERGAVEGVLPGERPTTVAMVGDSITVASTSELETALEALDLEVLLIDAQVGRRMTVGERGRLVPGSDVVQYVSGVLEPELWVVALGTNDIGQYPDVDRVAEQVADILDHIPADVPVVWIDTWVRDRPDQARAVNEAIRSVVAGRSGAIVVDWATPAAAEGVLSADGVHLSDRIGRARFAEVVAEGVATLIGPDPAP